MALDDGAGAHNGANGPGTNGAADAATQDVADQATLVVQNATMLATAQANMAAMHHIGFPPNATMQHQRGTTTPASQNLQGYQQQLQFGFLQMQFAQQMQQGLGMPGFFPINPFVQAQMFLPLMQFPFQNSMAPFLQQALGPQSFGQMGSAVRH